MSSTVSYDYAFGDLLENRNSYFYTKFHGDVFLTAWRDKREAVLREKNDPSCPIKDDGNTPIDNLLTQLRFDLTSDKIPSKTLQLLNRLVQRFEVTKRLHDEYNENWRPIDPQKYHGLERYVLFAEVLDLAYISTSALPYLNALLKCMDTLIALHNRMGSLQKTRICNLITCERRHIENLQLKIGMLA